MVRLTKIYTKTGDSGTTGLGNGVRVSKTHLRVEAYGTVDEANAAIGVAIVALGGATGAGSAGTPATAGPAAWGVLADLLQRVQHDLFDVGADLATPIGPDETPGQRLRVQEEQTTALERAIDRFNADLAPLNSFVLPGGTGAAAALHVARTVVRRAERLTVALAESEPDTMNAEAVRYLNRLSDLLFVLARVANANGAADILWVPGKNRSGM